MKVVKLIVGQLSTNCYLLIDEDSKNALIIDPGDDAFYIQKKIEEEEAIPVQIIATHGHFDHILAATDLKLIYNIPFLMNKKDEFLIQRMNSSARHFTNAAIKIPHPEIDKYLEKGDVVRLNNTDFNIILTPGHTPGSISLYSKKEKKVFAGDLIFKNGGVGRYDFSYANKNKLYNSINKILSLPKNTKIYSGHGEFSLVEKEQSYFRNT